MNAGCGNGENHRRIIYDSNEGPCPVCELAKKAEEQEKELLGLYRKVANADSGIR